MFTFSVWNHPKILCWDHHHDNQALCRPTQYRLRSNSPGATLARYVVTSLTLSLLLNIPRWKKIKNPIFFSSYPYKHNLFNHNAACPLLSNHDYVHDDMCDILICFVGYSKCLINIHLLSSYFEIFCTSILFRAISVTPRGLALELESATYLHMQLYFQLVCIAKHECSLSHLCLPLNP